MHLADIAQLNNPRTVRFDQSRLTIEDIVDIAQGRATAVLSDDPAFRAASSAAPISSTACCARTA
jgi:histidine ammonia-lyase